MSPLLSAGDGLHPCFASLFQGDHLGVEFALQGHEDLLQRHGLLDRRAPTEGALSFSRDISVGGPHH